MPAPSDSHARVITSLNLKGGVGKTHLCWLLASVCQERGHRCLIVDLDQQANITQSFLPNHADPTGIERLFNPADNAEPRDLMPSRPFSMETLPPPAYDERRGRGAIVRRTSRHRYARPVSEVHAEIDKAFACAA
jgi:cellulose biosynthesis protein BcsQ